MPPRQQQYVQSSWVIKATVVQHQLEEQQQAFRNPCDVGDFLDVVKHEIKINREVDWDSPPKFDEYPNEANDVLHLVDDTRDDNGVRMVEDTKVKVQEKIVEAAENKFHDNHYYEDPFYPIGFINSSDSWIIKKLIIDYIILTRWTDWMDVCVEIGKVVARLQHSMCYSSFRIIICRATSIRAITCLIPCPKMAEKATATDEEIPPTSSSIPAEDPPTTTDNGVAEKPTDNNDFDTTVAVLHQQPKRRRKNCPLSLVETIKQSAASSFTFDTPSCATPDSTPKFEAEAEVEKSEVSGGERKEVIESVDGVVEGGVD
ncbi:hypothetical protein RHSIM_Rhsim04G0117800 [Rhododendron simsii]|uniref:Uncharacterized protein n=1 Tax=Rhododendron simsii TaxID=118357 RepID=A0A834H387_RHOSS|nr:hypothetical protein RHSIM_Rhsim04G0117800 [Rhododendron simsii]